MSRLDVGIRQLENDVTVLDLKGFVDRHTVTTLDSALKGLIEKGQTRILINCGELGYLSSAGIGVFMSQLIKVNKSGGTLKFCAMNRHVKTLMDVAGFSKVLEIYDTEKQALARFASAPSTASAATPEDDGEALRIAVREDPSQKIASLTLHGDVDRHTLAILETELTRLLEASFTKLVVSCEGVTFLSSNGMGVFIQYVQRARQRQGDIRFCRMRDNALTVMTMLGLQNIFQVFQTEEEAIASYQL